MLVITRLLHRARIRINYAFEYEAGELTVGKATLTVSANDKSREYGEANPTFDGDISGFKNNDTASVVTVDPLATAVPRRRSF